MAHMAKLLLVCNRTLGPSDSRESKLHAGREFLVEGQFQAGAKPGPGLDDGNSWTEAESYHAWQALDESQFSTITHQSKKFSLTTLYQLST
jgi:hypothetical protein